jgi:hypothetical protein
MPVVYLPPGKVEFEWGIVILADNDKDIIERWGRLFKRANSGMDEEQVTTFVDELIRERDMLLKQQEHFFSLIRLAERAIGTDGTAKQGVNDAVVKASEQARPIIGGEETAEAVAMPTRGTEASTAKAQHQFQEMIGTLEQPDGEEPEPDWEVQILPPIDIMQALAVMTALDNLSEIKKTELIPDIKKPIITVFVDKPLSLIDKLRALPQVAEIKEGATNGSGNGSGTGGKARKVQIVLSEKSISEKG